MGGKGAASGISEAGYKYGTEYRTLLQVGDIKFVRNKTKNSSSLPLETRTSGRIYALINEKNRLRAIGFYGEDGKRILRIDIEGRPHKSKKDGKFIPTPHAQYGYQQAEKTRKLKPRERKLVRKLKMAWYGRER